MGFSLKQCSFSGGILSPQLLSRSDAAKYAAGLRTCINAQVQRFGGLQSRPGTLYCDAETYQSCAAPWSSGITYVPGSSASYSGQDWIAVTPVVATPPAAPAWTLAPGFGGAAQQSVRIIKFIVDYDNSYELIFSINNIRVVKNGVPVTVQLSSMAAWSTSVSYVIGNIVEVAATPYICLSPNTNENPSSNPTLWKPMVAQSTGIYWLDIPVNTTLSSLYFTLPQESLRILSAVNYNDVMTVTSQYFPPFQLTRYSDTNWTVTPYVVMTTLPAVTGVTATAGSGSGPTETYYYAVTAIAALDGTETLISNVASCVAYQTLGSANIINWYAVAGAKLYNIYKLVSGVPGLIGSAAAGTTVFGDAPYQPNYSIQPPAMLTNPDGSALFSTVGNFPAVCAYFQQRLLFANTVNLPTTIWMSMVGVFYDMAVSTPLQDAGPIQITIPGDQTQPVVAMKDVQHLIVHTASAEYALSGNQYNSLTPTACVVALQGTKGCSQVPPITIGNTDIFVQARGTQLHDLRFEVASFTYTGKDLTTFATQLFIGQTVVAMDWQQIPDSIIWVVMSNGYLYGLTYLQDQNIWCWHQHVFTNGWVEDVCVVPNAAADVVYVMVRRVINGVTVRYLEQLSNRQFLDTVYYSDFCGTDGGAIINNSAQVGSVTVNLLPPQTVWNTENTMVITATGATPFSAGTVGNQIVLSQVSAVTGLVTDRVTFRITGYVSSTVVEGYALRDVPTWAQATAIAAPNWGIALTILPQVLPQLAGQQIAVLGDGNVLADPLDAAYPVITVASDGSVTLPGPTLTACLGLPIQMDLQTLPVENAQGQTLLDRHVTVRECCPIFYYSRGGWFGVDPYHLKPWVQPRGGPDRPATFVWMLPIVPWTGPVRIPLQAAPRPVGQVWIRLTNPVPFAMGGIITTIEVADG